ncbi:MAG: RNA-binding domain-containing protein [Candidatus Margulisiibacteriota bacterium]
MNWDDIIELLEQGEGQSVEFEKVIPSEDDIARELVAFSNADGGKIVYGIDDKNKHLIGVEIDHNFEDWIKDIGKNHCNPPITPTIEIIEKGDKKIVILTVPEGLDKPYRSDEICYIRDGNTSRPAKENEEKELINPWSGKGLNKRQIRALQMMTEHGSITNREYREAFNVSHKTAHLELTMLEDKKLVKSEGAGRSTRYILVSQPEEN